jgi:hypothetical protein
VPGEHGRRGLRGAFASDWQRVVEETCAAARHSCVGERHEDRQACCIVVWPAVGCPRACLLSSWRGVSTAASTIPSGAPRRRARLSFRGSTTPTLQGCSSSCVLQTGSLPLPLPVTPAQRPTQGKPARVEHVTKGFMETQKPTLEAMFNKFEHKFPGGEPGGGPGDEKDDLAAVRKMQLERLNVSGTGGAGNIAVIQVALTRLSEGAKNACNAALTEERSFEQSFGLCARLQIARGEAMKKSEYNSPKSPSPTFEAFGNYMAIVFAILTAD